MRSEWQPNIATAKTYCATSLIVLNKMKRILLESKLDKPWSGYFLMCWKYPPMRSTKDKLNLDILEFLKQTTSLGNFRKPSTLWIIQSLYISKWMYTVGWRENRSSKLKSRKSGHRPIIVSLIYSCGSYVTKCSYIWNSWRNPIIETNLLSSRFEGEVTRGEIIKQTSSCWFTFVDTAKG